MILWAAPVITMPIGAMLIEAIMPMAIPIVTAIVVAIGIVTAMTAPVPPISREAD